jgi:hypothetical protein
MDSIIQSILQIIFALLALYYIREILFCYIFLLFVILKFACVTIIYIIEFLYI